jgi:hypothetical protein
VLPGSMAWPARYGKHQCFDVLCFVHTSGDTRQAPDQSPLYRCSRHGSPYMW